MLGFQLHRLGARARCLRGRDLQLPGSGEARRASDRDRAASRELADMAGVIGVVDLLAVDHPVAEVTGPRPREIATAMVDCGGVQQGL